MSESNQNLPGVGPSEADESWRTAVALFRYTTILPLLRHNRDTDGSKMDAATPFTLVLLGQPDLRHMLQLKGFEALDQRINVRYHVQPFALEESASYVKHPLRVVGVERCPFSDSFIAAAHQFSHGIPRQLNRVCLNGLLIGMNDRQSILDETDARRAIIELDRPG